MKINIKTKINDNYFTIIYLSIIYQLRNEEAQESGSLYAVSGVVADKAHPSFLSLGNTEHPLKMQI